MQDNWMPPDAQPLRSQSPSGAANSGGNFSPADAQTTQAPLQAPAANPTANQLPGSDQGAFQQALTKTGAFDIPVLGGALRAVSKPLLTGAETVAQAGGELGSALTGQTSAPQFVSNDMQNLLNQRTQAGLEGFTKPSDTTKKLALEGLKQSAAVASYGVPAIRAFGGSTIAPTLGNLALHGGITGALFGAGQAPVGQINPGSIAAYGGLGAIAEPTLSYLLSGMLTKAGVGKKLAQGANESDQSMTWNDLQDQIRAKASDKLGDNAATKQSVENFLATRSPASESDLIINKAGGPPIEDVADPTGQAAFAPTPLSNAPAQKLVNPDLNANSLLNLRRQLDASYEQPFYSKLFTKSSMDDKVAAIARSVVRDNLHKVAPGTILPDQLMTLYMKKGIFGGDFPVLLVKALGAAGALGAANKIIGGARTAAPLMGGTP